MYHSIKSPNQNFLNIELNIRKCGFFFLQRIILSIPKHKKGKERKTRFFTSSFYLILGLLMSP